MPTWTKEQLNAIEDEGHNILVSAGAGSGKTAVLSERALRIVKSGVNIDEILILTFTNKAAYEMMIRIRNKIKAAKLFDQVNRIDKAYITTFDAFSLSIVKKYHDRLNITKNVKIVDENVINSLKKDYLDEIMQEFYQENNPDFSKLINDFCYRDDKELKKYILEINNKLDLKYDKLTYLNNYIESFYKDEVIDKRITEYEDMLNKIIIKIKDSLKKLELILDYDSYNKYSVELKPLLEAKNYDQVKNSLNIDLPRLSKNSSDILKQTKNELSDLIDEVKKITIYDSRSSMITDYKKTSIYLKPIIEIILKLDKKITQYKLKHNVFEFTDISKLAIDLVKKNPDIKEELKNSFHEIMIDEYQDTSDLQEEFINEIANNNIYMVGDIKQSIYRFRNANPLIFKEKYDKYTTNIGGSKIDLNKNFRSRKEVLSNINDIFDFIMDSTFGGAKYKESHQMIFGNNSYIEEGLTKQNYNIDLLNYHIEKDSQYQKYSKEEIEAFIIASDIKNKIASGYQIFDKDTKVLRKVNYGDFVILMDRSKSFTLYKKIFEYMKIPLTILKNENIADENEVYLLKNILILIDCLENNDFTNRFNYSFLSISRSYLFRYSDQEIFNIIKNNDYENTEIIKKIRKITSQISKLDLVNLLKIIIDEFDFYNKLITYGNIESGITVLEYFLNLVEDLQEIGYTYHEFISYLENIIENKSKIEIPISVNTTDSAKIMTIHTSKGLEYSICYYSGLYAPFNLGELKEKILYDNEYGIITPCFDNGYQDTFYKELVKNKYYLEEISEKIRLFYVGLTRCKEKMIMVADIKEESFDIDYIQKEKYRSFLDILKSIYQVICNYIVDVNLDDILITDEYKILKINKVVETNNKDLLEVDEYKIDETLLESTKFSKTVNKLIDINQFKNMKYGIKIHEIFELIDFKNPNLDNLDISDDDKKYVVNFLNQPILKDIDKANIYKEYEFYIIDDNKEEKHGIIDLMLEYTDHIDIIDYKLKNISDLEYNNQLKGYQKYIENKTKKQVNIYLYSIIDNKIESL